MGEEAVGRQEVVVEVGRPAAVGLYRRVEAKGQSWICQLSCREGCLLTG